MGIRTVIVDSEAGRSGDVKIGDKILSVNGASTASMDHDRILAALTAEDTVVLELTPLKNHKPVESPRAPFTEGVRTVVVHPNHTIGFSLSTDDDALLHHILSVVPHSSAWKAGVHEGDVLLTINGVELQGLTHKEVVQQLVNAGELTLTLARDVPQQENKKEAQKPFFSSIGLVGPSWTRGEMEAPAGEKDMGGWTSLVYTAEQQERLGVDEHGQKKEDGEGDEVQEQDPVDEGLTEESDAFDTTSTVAFTAGTVGTPGKKYRTTPLPTDLSTQFFAVEQESGEVTEETSTDAVAEATEETSADAVAETEEEDSVEATTSQYVRPPRHSIVEELYHMTAVVHSYPSDEVYESVSTEDVTLTRAEKGFGFAFHCPYFRYGAFVNFVSDDGPAFRDGRLKQGDKIIAINGEDVTTADEAIVKALLVGSETTATITVKHMPERSRSPPPMCKPDSAGTERLV